MTARAPKRRGVNGRRHRADTSRSRAVAGDHQAGTGGVLAGSRRPCAAGAGASAARRRPLPRRDCGRAFLPEARSRRAAAAIRDGRGREPALPCDRRCGWTDCLGADVGHRAACLGRHRGRTAASRPDRVRPRSRRGRGIHRCREGCDRRARSVCAASDLESFCRTTGGKGLHVVVPLQPVSRLGCGEAVLPCLCRDDEPGRAGPLSFDVEEGGSPRQDSHRLAAQWFGRHGRRVVLSARASRRDALPRRCRGTRSIASWILRSSPCEPWLIAWRGCAPTRGRVSRRRASACPSWEARQRHRSGARHKPAKRSLFRQQNQSPGPSVVAGLDPAICAPPAPGRWPGQARPRRRTQPASREAHFSLCVSAPLR